jgi:trans-2,3-dihydro-3-hydroxyanthranilate isomerase
MQARFVTADVFTDRRFGGNQLAVLPDSSGIPPELFQSIAREFNYAETTFVLPPADTRHAARVRIFTPGAELPFAGHPTIGTAHVLASIGAIPLTGDETKIVFEEAAGLVPVTVHARDGKPTFAQLTSPQVPAIVGEAPDVESLAELLSINTNDVLLSPVGPAVVSGGIPLLFVPLKDNAVVARARLNLNTYELLMRDYISDKVYIFSLEGEGLRGGVHARMFAPAIGIAEDPATGGGAVALGGYLAMLEPLTEGTLRWKIEQGVEINRPSLLEVEADKKAGKVTAVRVGGSTVLVSEGTMTL